MAGLRPASVDWTRPIAYAAVAGSATALGGALVLCFRGQPSNEAIAFTLAFAAGVMSIVSVVDLWWPIAALGFLPFCGATAAMLAGMACTNYLSRLSFPEPEALLATIMNGGVEGGGGGSGGGGGGGGGGAAATATGSDGSAKAPGEGAAEHEAVSLLVSSSSSGGGGGTAGAAGAAAAALPPSAAGAGAALAAAEGGSAAAGAQAESRARSWRLGMLLALVLTVHNLPEGLAVGVSALKSRELGLALASAIFLHNVAEGVVIAVPLLAATGNRWLALGITAASGVSEPLGAALGVLLLRGVSAGNSAALELGVNITLCAVGGVMLQVSRSELLPQARRLGSAATVWGGFAAGGVLIGASLVLLDIFQ